MMVKIFISYRRADSRKDAGRIYDRLVDAFGKDNVFKDVDSIPLGKDFRGILREAVAQCDVQLAIIGGKWLDIRGEDGKRRLDNAGDFVRIEVESALQRDSCLVIPVLVDNAMMPNASDLPDVLRELAFKNAISVRDDPDFHKDVDRIIGQLRQEYQVRVEPSRTEQKAKARSYNVKGAIANFYEAFDNKQWERAREILIEIRASDKAPRIFNVDSHEQDVWDAIEAEERDDQYNLIRLMAQRGNPKRTWEALQIFWQDFPDYDPDGLVETAKPAPVVIEIQNDVLTKARNFKGTRNSDWTPVIESFEAQGLNLDMCLVPVGSFQMGSDRSDREKPIHEQQIVEPYWVGTHPITNQQWRYAVDHSGGAVKVPEWTNWYKDSSKDTHPVVGVTWYQVMDFIKWLGTDWRLPTELEWEYAARGVESLTYPFGDDFQADWVVYSENSDDSTASIGGRPSGASWVGAQDMSGNVWDWTSSLYKDYPYDLSDGREDMSSDGHRVLRGGSWVSYDSFARSASRSYFDPNFNDYDIGFRLFRPPSQ